MKQTETTPWAAFKVAGLSEETLIGKSIELLASSGINPPIPEYVCALAEKDKTNKM